MTTTLQIRIDSNLKNSLRKRFASEGVDLSTGFRLWAKNAVETKGPIIRTVNGFTPEYEKRVLASLQEAKLHGKRYSDVRQMLKEI